ncbi:hypothetical protein GQ54DRAFT_296664 [Martensiomyces pterosporus]|nr:hypothetical protein GQ54DRAFT_296664 [Martensiomyces pterosporus]
MGYSGEREFRIKSSSAPVPAPGAIQITGMCAKKTHGKDAQKKTAAKHSNGGISITGASKDAITTSRQQQQQQSRRQKQHANRKRSASPGGIEITGISTSKSQPQQQPTANAAASPAGMLIRGGSAAQHHQRRQEMPVRQNAKRVRHSSSDDNNNNLPKPLPKRRSIVGYQLERMAVDNLAITQQHAAKNKQQQQQQANTVTSHKSTRAQPQPQLPVLQHRQIPAKIHARTAHKQVDPARPAAPQRVNGNINQRLFFASGSQLTGPTSTPGIPAIAATTASQPGNQTKTGSGSGRNRRKQRVYNGRKGERASGPATMNEQQQQQPGTEAKEPAALHPTPPPTPFKSSSDLSPAIATTGSSMDAETKVDSPQDTATEDIGVDDLVDYEQPEDDFFKVTADDPVDL